MSSPEHGDVAGPVRLPINVRGQPTIKVNQAALDITHRSLGLEVRVRCLRLKLRERPRRTHSEERQWRDQ